MNKRKFWLFALILIPLALAVPLYGAASWRPHELGVHPIRGVALPPIVAGAMAIPPQYQLMMSPDNAHLLSISSESKPYGLAMWDAKDKTVIWSKLQSGDKNWSPLCFSRDGQTLAMTENFNLDAPNFGESKPGLALFDVASGKQIAVLPVAPFTGNSGSFADAAFSPDGKQFIAAVGNEVRTWNIAARRETSHHTAKVKPKDVYATIALAPTGTQFIVGLMTLSKASVPSYVGAEMRDSNSDAIAWKMPTGISPRFNFSPDGTKILSSDQSSLFEMRDVRTGRVIWKKTVVNAGFNDRYWLPDSSAIVMSMDGVFEMWSAQTGAVVRSLPVGEMQDFVIAPDGSQVYMVDFDGQIWRQRLK